MLKAIQRYVVENMDDLLKWDMHVARVLGAPAPQTLSSYSYKLEQEGKVVGKITRPIIDVVFGQWVMGEKEHCKHDFARVTELLGVATDGPIGQPAAEATETKQETSN